MAFTPITFVDEVTLFTAAVGNNLVSGINEGIAKAEAAQATANEGKNGLIVADNVGAVSTNQSLSLEVARAFRMTIGASITATLTNLTASVWQRIYVYWEATKAGSALTFPQVSKWINGLPAFSEEVSVPNLAELLVLDNGTIVGLN